MHLVSLHISCESEFYFLGPTGLQGTHMDTLKPKNSKLIRFTVRGCFFTFWAMLDHSVPPWLISICMCINCLAFVCWASYSSMYLPTSIYVGYNTFVGAELHIQRKKRRQGVVQFLATSVVCTLLAKQIEQHIDEDVLLFAIKK